MQEMLDLGEVPFYWRMKSAPVQAPLDIPARLPFAFSFLQDVGLVIQQRNQDVLDWLKQVYVEDANVGYLQEGHALAEAYGNEFLDFFLQAAAMLASPPSKVADIGCGGVYLLQRLKEKGYSVTGIDPSPVTAEAGRKAGIEIVSDFYPSYSLTTRFDVLFHYDVLEHVEDPVAFLQAHHANISEHGGLVLAVPDCSHHIRLGDVSMLLHEHLNYFDEESLANVVRAAGFEPRLLRPAKYGGVLLCFATPKRGGAAGSREARDVSSDKFLAFHAKATAARERFANLLDSIPEGEDLGVYVPLRAFPYIKSVLGNLRLRFFDDDPGLRGRYFDGFDVPVESFADLQENPPGNLVVCSHSFGEKIVARLKENKLPEMRLVMWKDFFSDQFVPTS